MIVTQSGASNPVEQVFDTNMVYTPVWTRDSEGNYLLTFPFAIDVSKVFVTYSNVGVDTSGEGWTISHRVDGTAIHFFTFYLGVYADGVLYDTCISVEVKQ